MLLYLYLFVFMRTYIFNYMIINIFMCRFI